MLTVARVALGVQRMIDNADSRENSGKIPDTSTITTRDALRWVTIEGARMLGLEEQIGSLTPGKQADMVVLRTGLNLLPVHDPVSTVIMQSNVSNVEHVLVAGQFRKRDGWLLRDDIAGKTESLSASGHRIARELGLREAAKGA
jgi:cytosine/adenosine deaminase-related metal-dependent hydrolase